MGIMMSERVDFNIDCHDFDKSKSRNDNEKVQVDCHDFANAKSRNDKTKHEAAAKLAMIIKRLKRKGKNE